jgi:microcystin-dependent protein
MKAPVSFDNFPTFAANGSRDMNPESAKYSVGFVPADTFPAEWANYMFHGATKGVSDLNTAVASIWAENANVLTQAGITPEAENNGQLYSAIMKFINDAVLTANQQVLAQAKLDAHPVGSLYWSSSPTDPATLFGGTWTQIKDKFIWAKGDFDTVNATGGSKNVVLTENNLPAHTHSFSGTTGNVSGSGSEWTHSHSMTLPIYGGNDFQSYIRDARFCGDNYRRETTTVTGYTSGQNLQHTHSFSGTTGNGNGTASAIDIMPPHIVKYCWERIS